MTPDTLRATLAELGWSLRHLSRVLNRPGAMNWPRDGYGVPPNVAAWLLRRLEAHRKAMRDDPPPGAR